jgi:spore germination protein KC
VRRNRWENRIKLLCCVLFIFPCVTGCWDRLEIEERANILGIAIDVADPTAAKTESEISHLRGKFPIPNESMVKITAQIAVPGRIPLGPETGGGTDGEPNPVWVLSTVGHTLEDAILNLQQEVADRLFLGHLRVIVISDSIARRGIAELNDYLRRNPEVRRAAWMIVSKGKADTLMKTSPQLERVPALYLSAMMEHAVSLGKFPNDFVGIFWSASSSKGREPFLPLVEVKKEQNVEISGMAYFRGDKMVGVLKPLEIGFYMAVMGIEQGGYAGFTPLPGTTETVLVRSASRRAKILVDLVDGRPHVKVKIQVEGDLGEKTSERVMLSTPGILAQIERELAQRAKQTIADIIKKTQTDSADIFGFGEQVRAKLPAYWNRHVGTKTKWQSAYKHIPVDVDFNIKIRRVGMKAR